MTFKTLAVAASLALTAGTASAAIVQNGSFEDNAGYNNGNTWGTYDSIPGWTAVPGQKIEIQDNNTISPSPDIDAQDGDWYVELDSDFNSGMYQDVTFANAGKYVLSFWYTPHTSEIGDNRIDYSLAGLATGTVDGQYYEPWKQVISDVFEVVAGQTVRLSFNAGGTSNSLGGFIDNVSIAPVPLPAAGLLLMGGLAGLGAVARRRRQA